MELILIYSRNLNILIWKIEKECGTGQRTSQEIQATSHHLLALPLNLIIPPLLSQPSTLLNLT